MTRAPEPAIARQAPHADDRATEVLPPARPAPRAKPPAPAVPEVPAIADLAAPGRPDVDAVLTPEAPPAPRRPRPSRRMRARADEMARVLSPAGRRPRRGLSSVPAAAAVMAAVAVGGVGIALGLDAQRTGQQVDLPDIPQVPAERTPIGTGSVEDGGTTPTARASLLDTVDDGDAARGATARRVTPRSRRRSPHPGPPAPRPPRPVRGRRRRRGPGHRARRPAPRAPRPRSARRPAPTTRTRSRRATATPRWATAGWTTSRPARRPTRATPPPADRRPATAGARPARATRPRRGERSSRHDG